MLAESVTLMFSVSDLFVNNPASAFALVLAVETKAVENF